MSNPKTVRNEAQSAFDLDQKSPEPQYDDFTDILPTYCEKHGHPEVQNSLCLCKMLCNSNDEEVIMAAMLFLDADPETEGNEVGLDTFIVFVPDSALEDMDTVNDVDDAIETYADQGAAKVSLSQLIEAFNKVNGTNHSI